MIYCYQVELKRAEKIGNPTLVSQYDFEGYYQQQVQSFTSFTIGENSYDPNLPIPKELLPYYKLFYDTFIDSLSPASVNINGSTVKQIQYEMRNCPTVGMYDAAKDEIVEMMYNSIYPILLRNNKKHLIKKKKNEKKLEIHL